MISQSEKKRFRAIAHRLKPVVTISGNGLSESVISELERALADHELIKIKVIADRDERGELTTSLCTQTNATLVQSIGSIAVIYRSSPKPNPKLSNVLRADVL